MKFLKVQFYSCLYEVCIHTCNNFQESYVLRMATWKRFCNLIFKVHLYSSNGMHSDKRDKFVNKNLMVSKITAKSIICEIYALQKSPHIRYMQFLIILIGICTMNNMLPYAIAGVGLERH